LPTLDLGSISRNSMGDRKGDIRLFSPETGPRKQECPSLFLPFPFGGSSQEMKEAISGELSHNLAGFIDRLRVQRPSIRS
jgi:hypothetical protein